MAAISARIAVGTITGATISTVARPMFQIGERVVHPQHGVGQIVQLEEREFERGETRIYYEIHIPGGSTVWVPVDLSNSGLRRLADKSEIAHCREILSARPLPLTDDAKLRQSTLVAHLRQGTIVAHCEVVRDLYAFVAHKPLYGTIGAFLEGMLRVLCQEWAMVEGISTSEAMSEISSLLDKPN